jgi:spartin
VTLPQDGSQNIVIGPAPHEYISKDMHPAYQKSSLVNRATKASQLFVTTSDFVTRSMQAGADNFAKSTKPVKPVTFTPTTHENIRRINTFSTQAATLSATTVGTITKYAQNFGASVAKRKDGRARGFDKDGNPIATYKPGVLNKSLMAFNTVVDGVEQAGRNLLQGTSSSVSQVVGHRWGEEAGEVAGHIGGGFKNVGLVYIDVTGVSRRAILKSVAKGMVVGNVKGGGQVVVGGNGSGNASVNASTDDVTKSSGKSSPHAASGALGNESQASGRYTAQSEYADTASIASGRPLLDRQTSSKSASKPNYY